MLWRIPVNSSHPFPPPFVDVVPPKKRTKEKRKEHYR